MDWPASVRRYLPPYNILLRDDKSLQYVRIDYDSAYPTVTTVRRPLDDGARYFGPYLHGAAVKKALRLLRKIFPYAISKPGGQKRASLHYHLGLDPGLEEGRTSLADYRSNLRKLMKYLRGQRSVVAKEIEKEMRRAAKRRDFEAASRLRNQLFALQSLGKQVIFGDREFMDLSRDKGLDGLARLLKLKTAPRRIEGFDVSHLQGSDNVASMVVFVGGIPDKSAYRKFKLRLPGNDDAGHIRETLSRRLAERNIKNWGRPDLVLVDGGRGQLAAALQARDACGQTIPMIGLAKREEEVILRHPQSFDGAFLAAVGGRARVSSDLFTSLMLPKNSDIVMLLQRIRDESHRFAVSYHHSLKRARQTRSRLDDIPGIGPLTRKKLLRGLGSWRAVSAASETELAALVGSAKARLIRSYLGERWPNSKNFSG